MVLLAILFTGIVTFASNSKQNPAFPLELSTIIVSFAYIGIVIVINILFGYIFKINIPIFFGIHIICLALYGLITLLMFLVKNSILKQNDMVNHKIHDIQILICEFEKIRAKLSDIPYESAKKISPLLDNLIDDLLFSDLGSDIEVSDIDSRLRNMANMLSKEIDNLIVIKSDDTTSLESMISDIKKAVKDRDLQIKLKNSAI